MKRTILSVACLTLAGSVALFGCKAKTAEADATDAAATTETTATAPTETTAAAPTEAAATTAAGTFDINTVPVTSANLGTWPYLSALKGYKTNYDSDSVGFDFDRAYVYDGKNIVAVEGKIVSRRFRPADSDKPASELMMQRNYENLVKSLGGTKVFSGEVPEDAIKKIGETEYLKHDNDITRAADTYVIRQKDKEVWVQVQPTGSDYVLNVIEKAAMPQQAGVVGATELKKN
ncbi:hypothetical protein [Hymenobacter cellulosilyticus]|uniref:Lipoprotein n=1 Tax=Hymenobacter cellulosilyticus TaxID=2932248 RepID=A0A8T9QCI9_9BACT|nr:hypothetical protein [Hymenobacter cellulosilyticus]UOQ73848.1 hypothetical protein MUN79_08025 [Hymenobacter cellulosilyticus]